MAKAKKKTVRKKVLKRKTVKKTVRKKPVKRPVRKKTVKRKTVRKKPVKKVVRKKTVKKKVIKKSIRRKVGFYVAKKRKKAVKKARAGIRRIVGGKGMQDTLMKGAGVVAGAVGAGFIANQVPIKDPRIKAVIPIIMGLLLSNVKMLKGQAGQAMTLGMVAAGGLALVKQFAPNIPVLAGEGEEFLDYISPEEQEAAMLGYYDDDPDSDEFAGGEEEDIEDALTGESEDMLGEEDEDWVDVSDF